MKYFNKINQMKKAIITIICSFIILFAQAQKGLIENKLFQNIENPVDYKYYQKDYKVLSISAAIDENDVFSGSYFHYGFSDTCIISESNELKSEGMYYFEVSSIDFEIESIMELLCAGFSLEKIEGDKLQLVIMYSSMQQYVILREVDMDTLSQPFLDFLKTEIKK